MRKFTCTCIFLLIFVSACVANSPQKICFEKTCVNLEVVDTELSRAKGLMFREYLPDKNGMFFIFPREDIYSFWMKHTLIPLDIIWLDKDLRVVYSKSFIPPCETQDCPVYTPEEKARYVLEVNAGFCDFYQIKVNDKAYFKND